MKIVGIYKITSPTGKVYIGQSWDVKKRWREYKKPYVLIRQPLIFRSISKYGLEAHIFELIHELPNDVNQDTLNRYEQLYMDQYRACGVQLLNCREAGSIGKLSESTKEKIRLIKTGTKMSDKAKVAMSLAGKGRKKSLEHRRKIGEANKVSQVGIICGVNNPKNKLSESQVSEIRRRHVPFKKRGNLLLAIEFGVSVSAIERITSKTGKTRTWKE